MAAFEIHRLQGNNAIEGGVFSGQQKVQGDIPGGGFVVGETSARAQARRVNALLFRDEFAQQAEGTVRVVELGRNAPVFALGI